MDDFELELKMGFLEEASQLLTDTEQCFLSLEHSPDNSSLVDKIFRLAHNLKGSSKAVGFDEMGAFAHEFENLLLKIKNNEIKINASIIGLLLRCNDHIRLMVEELKTDINSKCDSSELISIILATLEGRIEDQETEGTESTDDFNGDVNDGSLANATRIDFDSGSSRDSDLDLSQDTENESGLDFQFQSRNEKAGECNEFDKSLAENAIAEKNFNVAALKASEVIQDAKAFTSSKAHQPVADESIRVSLARLEKLLNFVGEIVILQTVLREQTLTSSTLVRKTIGQLSKVTKEVQDISMSLRMVPLKQTFQKMQRIVRDTSGGLNKKVNLIVQGEETEVDKTVLEHLNDPLVHLIRNAVDHGIETAEKRKLSGKSEVGSVTLNAYHQSGKLVIEVRDDGGGVDAEVIRSKAIDKGLVNPNTPLSNQDCLQLLFAPGFSTKAVVTDVSGRGVGMDVVKTNIEGLQGEVLIETELGKGTLFKVVLPLTLAIIDALVVESEQQRFIIPLTHVHESVQAKDEDIQESTLLGEVLMLRGENLPLYRMPQLLGKKLGNEKRLGIAMVIRNGEKPFCVMVDDILGQHQVVVKKLGNEVSNLKGFSGSAILGDGKPALILELSELAQVIRPTDSNAKRRTAA